MFDLNVLNDLIIYSHNDLKFLFFNNLIEWFNFNIFEVKCIILAFGGHHVLVPYHNYLNDQNFKYLK
jgi:hypothetical protein